MTSAEKGAKPEVSKDERRGEADAADEEGRGRGFGRGSTEDATAGTPAAAVAAAAAKDEWIKSGLLELMTVDRCASSIASIVVEPDGGGGCCCCCCSCKVMGSCECKMDSRGKNGGCLFA